MSHIFISYSHLDRDYAQRLAKDLEDLGLPVWIDSRIDYGVAWPRVIQEKLDGCAAFVVLMTPNSYKSDWVQSELARAKEKGKPIFPVLLMGEPWLGVQAIQCVKPEGEKLPADFYLTLGQAVLDYYANDPECPISTVSLKRIRVGTELLSVTSGADACRLDFDEPYDASAAQILQQFASNLNDDADVSSWGSLGDTVNATARFSENLKDLEQAGLYVYGERVKGELQTSRGVIKGWEVVIIVVSREDSQSRITAYSPKFTHP